VRGQKSP